MRWRIERDYQDLKQDLGLGHYEGRGWCGFHHHAVLSIAAYGFLVAERIAAANAPGVKKTPSHTKSLHYPKITFPAEAQRAQRHVPDSITTLRYHIAWALIARLARCPCCGQPISNLPYDTVRLGGFSFVDGIESAEEVLSALASSWTASGREGNDGVVATLQVCRFYECIVARGTVQCAPPASTPPCARTGRASQITPINRTNSTADPQNRSFAASMYACVLICRSRNWYDCASE